METFIRETVEVDLHNPILVGGFPGVGYVGKNSILYLINQLRAEELAELYSPYFPHNVVVDSRGSVRLTRAEFFYWQSSGEGQSDLILLTGDAQPQSSVGEYKVVNEVLNYVNDLGVKTVITIGGYRCKRASTEPKVFFIASTSTLLQEMLSAGGQLSPAGTPVEGFAGLILGQAMFKGMRAACLLGETVGYRPDPESTRAVLRILREYLGIKLELSSLSQEIERSKRIITELRDVQGEIEALVEERAEIEGRRIPYIS